ncbi:hypothetical protein [Candidatus Palauibacter irciniicola]|uniref:hypothetical protein n=1 Tax=Candidatus Palauibacter irciniicola TaxID=3056733 RepID=UPI003B010F41
MTAPAPAPFPWELPADARIVALVFRRSEAERSATAVDAIATSIARRRGRTLVLNAESGPSPLDELAGASERADAGGMAEFLGGQAGLAGIAVRRADCPYVYLPAGRVPEGVVGLLESAALARFVSRVKEQDGTLFIAMSDRGRPSDDLLGLLDGYIAVGSVPPEDHGMRCYGHVPFESSEPASRAWPPRRSPWKTRPSPPRNPSRNPNPSPRRSPSPGWNPSPSRTPLPRTRPRRPQRPGAAARAGRSSRRW